MNNSSLPSRRRLLGDVASVTAALASIGFVRSASAASSSSATAEGTTTGALRLLTDRLSAAPPQRNFKTVPLIVTQQSDWDHEAAAEVLAYQYKSRQVWDNSNLSGPWLGLMRESMNCNVFAFGNSDFLPVRRASKLFSASTSNLEIA